MESRGPLPRRYARYYLENAPSLVWLVVVNSVAILVGVRYYVETMPGVSTFLWPLYADSPTALFLMTLSLVTLWPFLGDSLEDVPVNRPLAYLHTIALVWLLKMGIWTVVALNLGFTVYFPALWAYFGIIVTHVGFIAEGALVPHYARTTRGALATALVLALANDLLDYGFGYYPPLRYEPGPALVVATVALSVGSVAVAARWLPRLEESGE
ncbi:DUF1405 domain-containing protein [Haloarcula salinisoli]|uniref:DUF1405 domain-containing protein n=1 Tax=Haloarcula salinisoli TaxID=2487746 RepID=A0A8J8C8V4_9EURY|nr:DUF1405 domain-containing protein [Halomicroarcula salinisoli]MBX0287593.1 DUF1405 domain-containing protein [Halomicroarcula salinisoli]MBX0304841.1 DUF1405 domain-containing protein [Halomicroarcula salinisoli]